MRSLAAEGRTVFVSSHLMSEMALTADHLLVIGRGRIIADMPLSELMARHSGERVEVRSADPRRMAADLRATGAEVTLELARPDGRLPALRGRLVGVRWNRCGRGRLALAAVLLLWTLATLARAVCSGGGREGRAMMSAAPGLAAPASGRDAAAGERPAGVDPSAAGFRVLALQVRAMGLLERRPGYYRVKIAVTVVAFFAGWALFVVAGNSWAAVAVAPVVGVMFTQLGFLGHDAGHNQAFATRRANHLLGLVVANALIGLSFGWWVPKHSAHHAHPNEPGRDPDIGDGVVLAFAGRPGDGPGPFGSWLARRQASLFFPLMLLRSAGLHVLGIRQLARRRDRAAAVEACLIMTHAALYLTVVLWVLSPLKALAFAAVQQAVFSLYLGVSFAPNHKGMPVTDAAACFARRQVITARNISGGRLTTFLLGGLNYQIEHHLFESMPRPNLRRAQGPVRDFCAAAGLGYREETFTGSFRQILRHLSDTGNSRQPPTRLTVEI